MKKIISLIASLSLLVASMAFAPVASAADKPTLEVEATKLTDFTEYPDYDFGEGYVGYIVTFNLTGLELETVMGTGMAKTKANGTSLSSYSIQYTAEVNGEKDSEWVFDTLSALGDKSLDTWNGKVHTFSYGNGSSMIYPAAGTAATIGKNDKIPVYQAILVMAEGETFKMTVNTTGCKINVSEFEKDSFKAGTRVESTLAVSDVTIPKAEVTGTAMVAGKDIEEGFYQGKTSVSTPEAVIKTDIETIEVSNDTKGATQTAALPTLLGAGKSKVLTIIVYDKADTELAGSIFTVKYLNAEGTALNTYTYQVPAAN